MDTPLGAQVVPQAWPYFVVDWKSPYIVLSLSDCEEDWVKKNDNKIAISSSLSEVSLLPEWPPILARDATVYELWLVYFPDTYDPITNRNARHLSLTNVAVKCLVESRDAYQDRLIALFESDSKRLSAFTKKHPVTSHFAIDRSVRNEFSRNPAWRVPSMFHSRFGVTGGLDRGGLCANFEDDEFHIVVNRCRQRLTVA